MEIPQKTKHRTTIWSSNPTPGHLPRENHDSQRHITPMFIAALFAIAKTWQPPKCPSTEEWIQKMLYIYTMEYYSAIKKNKIPAFLATWMDLETIMQVKSAIQWDTNIKCFHWHVESEKSTQWTSLQNRYWLTDFEKLMVSGGDSLGGGGMCSDYGMEILWNWIVMIITQLQMW